MTFEAVYLDRNNYRVYRPKADVKLEYFIPLIVIAAAILIARILTLCLPVLILDRNTVRGSTGRSHRTARTHACGRSQRTGSRQQQCPFVDD